MDEYSFSCPIQVRWRDLDPLHHVNNAAVVSYLEMARIELWRTHMGASGSADFPFVIARLEVDYRRPIRLFDQLEVGIRVGQIRSTSFVFEYRLAVGAATAVEASTIQVCIRKESGRPVRVPAWLLSTLEELSAIG